MRLRGLATTFLGISVGGVAIAQTWRGYPRAIRAEVEDGWIVASQGNDETAQAVRVKIWGKHANLGAWHQLDNDDEHEFVISSKNDGSGPYFRLQIVDFVSGGADSSWLGAILSWSYYSYGGPFVEDGFVMLGEAVPENHMARLYWKYRYTPNGLVKAGRYEGTPPGSRGAN